MIAAQRRLKRLKVASSTDKRIETLEGVTERQHDPLIILLPVGVRVVTDNDPVEFEFDGCWRRAENLDTAAGIVGVTSKSLVETIPFRAAQ